MGLGLGSRIYNPMFGKTRLQKQMLQLKHRPMHETVERATVEFVDSPERDEQLKELYRQKTALLDQHGIFGGGSYVNAQHNRINRQLEALGVDPNS